MTQDYEEYPHLFLVGVILFNDEDYFEAHEVWEDLWSESTGTAHKFVQGLIQMAVGLCHFYNGNLRGALKLYHTSREYLEVCGSSFWGLDLERFLHQHQRCHQKLLEADALPTDLEPDEDLLPKIDLRPPPLDWPDADPYRDEHD